MYCGTCGLRGLQAAGLLVDGSVSLPTHEVSQYQCWQVGDQGRAPVLMSWREDSTVAPASTSVHVVERAPPNGCLQCLCPHGESQMPPNPPRGSPRSACGSDPGSFQITASALGSGVCAILCVPFKSGVSVSHSPLALPEVNPTGLKAKRSGGSSSWCRTLGLWSPMWGSDPSLLGENLRNYNYPPVCGSPARGCGS